MKDFRNLKVREKSHALLLEIYRFTREFPKSELYGLTSQIRRSALPIPSNIAEGVGRGSDADLKRFLQIAFGSASELEYQLLLAFELNYLEDIKHQQLSEDLTQVKRMLSAFMQKLRAES
jgi:four helix bundle protein